MYRILIVAALLAALSPSAASAARLSLATGGGRGTVDGASPFSQFGFGVTVAADGTTRGRFNCLMAGASRFPGFDLMAVRGRITHAIVEENAAAFDGVGMFQTGNQGKSEATFHVVVTEGGAGVGTLQLTLETPFVFALPTERVLNGRILIE